MKWIQTFMAIWMAIKARKEMMAMKKIDRHEAEVLCQYNEIILDGICDAERTRTAELLYGRNWRDDLTVEEAIEMGKQIERVRGK